MANNLHIPGYDPSDSPNRLNKLAAGIRKWSHGIAHVPGVDGVTSGWGYLSDFGIIGYFTAALSSIATALDTIGDVSRGKIRSAIKSLISGAVDTLSTIAVATDRWGILPAISAIMGISSGSTAPEVIRTITRDTLDWVLPEKSPEKPFPQPNPLMQQWARQQQVFGAQPQITGAHAAAVAYGQPAMQPQMAATMPNQQAMGGGYLKPAGYWQGTEAERRGIPQGQMQQQWMRSGENQQSYKELIAAQQAAGQESYLG